MADDRTDLQREYNEALNKEADELINLEALRENARKLRREGTALTEAQKTAINDLAKSYKDLAKESERLADKLSLAEDQGDAVATALGRATGMTQDFERSVVGSTLALLESEDALKSFTDKMGKMFTKQKIGMNILSKFAEATMELAYSTDAALASFNKQTGATRKYGAEITALERNMFIHGVSIDDAAEAYGALTSTVTDLRLMSASSRKDLSTTTALLDHMGVSADTTAANVQLMTKSMGVSVAQASSFQRELFTLAQQLDMPPEQMAAGFKAAAPKLMAFGKQAGKVFKTLAVNARAAGMEVEQMLGIVEQFDTFEGAAESVGKLNALLGGPFLNSMEMVTTTDPTERMRMLSGALNDAGKSFDQMTYYEKKSIAAAAGLSDVNELALVMAGSFDKSAGGAGKSQAEIQKLAEQSQEFNTVAEEFTETMKMLAIEMAPLIQIIKGILQGIQNWYPLIKTLTPAIIALSGALMMFKTAQLMAANATGTFTYAWKLGPFGSALAAVAIFMTLGQVLGKQFAGGLAIGTAALLGLAMAFGVLQVSTGGIIFIITSLITGIIMLIQWLFGTDVGHSNFLEGLWKIGWAFGDIGTAITGLMGSIGPAIAAMFKFLTPLGIVMSIWDSIMGSSAETEKSMGRITSAEQPSVKNTIQPVEIVGVDPIRILGSILMPQSLYNAVGGKAKQGRDALMGSTGTGGIGGSGQPIKHEITLEFDPRKAAFKDFVIDIVNKELNANSGSPP
jgi:hypothetical protein